MLLGYLLGLEEGKLSEKERLANERRKIKEEHLNALREQYMLRLLMPVRGQETFKVVVEEPKNFDFSMVGELLKRIESPVKYFKYYKVGNTKVLEGYSIGTEEYESYKKLNLLQNTVAITSFVSVLFLLYILNEYILHLENVISLGLYVWFSLGFAITFGALIDFLAFPNIYNNIEGYGKL
jgi:hypothetical protein